MKKNLVLLGMMGVGKTTLGKLVAKNQGLEFIDTDANIENKNSMTINEIFEQKGEKESDDWFLQVGHLTFFLFNFTMLPPVDFFISI